jgi:NADH-quinone oxidoreductase subunit M
MLFLLIGMIYERYHTRQIVDYGGMASKMPLFGIFFVFTCLSSAGLPGLNGFIGEALCLFGIFQHEMAYGRGPILAVIAATSMVLGAWYLFTLLRRLLFGPTKEPAHEGHAVTDLTPREWLLLTPVAVLCVILGVYPGPVLDSARPDVEMVSYIADRARERAGRRPVLSQPVEASVAPSWLWAGGGR